MLQSNVLYSIHGHFLILLILRNIFSELASKTASTHETVYHTREISRMLKGKGKSAALASIGDDNVPQIG